MKATIGRTGHYSKINCAWKQQKAYKKRIPLRNSKNVFRAKLDNTSGAVLRRFYVYVYTEVWVIEKTHNFAH